MTAPDSNDLTPERIETIEPPLAKGFTTDDRGLFNNFAVEPKMYVEDSSSKQRPLPIVAFGAVVLIVLIGVTLAIG